MIKKLIKDKKGYFKCEECGFLYKDREWAAKCEKWCREHHSCNMEITKHAVKSE